MDSSVHRVLGVYELLEHIILQLDSIRDIIRAQRVSRCWRNAIHASPALLEACWYRPRPHDREDVHEDNTSHQPADPGGQTWELNPVLNCLGVSVKMGPGKVQECGYFSLQQRVYDKPGSWTGIYYIIESTTDFLLLGDIMAVLAECQNRQECGVDRWAGVMHYSGELVTVTEQHCRDDDWLPMLANMPDDVLIKVAVMQPWDDTVFPAFSLRRLHPPLPHPGPGGYLANSSRPFLHEMMVHRMIHDGYEFEWEWRRYGWQREIRLCKEREYEANLLVVREHSEGYLAEYSHIFRLISDVL